MGSGASKSKPPPSNEQAPTPQPPEPSTEQQPNISHDEVQELVPDHDEAPTSRATKTQEPVAPKTKVLAARVGTMVNSHTDFDDEEESIERGPATHTPTTAVVNRFSIAEDADALHMEELLKEKINASKPNGATSRGGSDASSARSARTAAFDDEFSHPEPTHKPSPLGTPPQSHTQPSWLIDKQEDVQSLNTTESPRFQAPRMQVEESAHTPNHGADDPCSPAEMQPEASATDKAWQSLQTQYQVDDGSMDDVQEIPPKKTPTVVTATRRRGQSADDEVVVADVGDMLGNSLNARTSSPGHRKGKPLSSLAIQGGAGVKSGGWGKGALAAPGTFMLGDENSANGNWEDEEDEEDDDEDEGELEAPAYKGADKAKTKKKSDSHGVFDDDLGMEDV